MRTATLTLPAGSRYASLYLADGGRWFNDADADGCRDNAFGGR